MCPCLECLHKCCRDNSNMFFPPVLMLTIQNLQFCRAFRRDDHILLKEICEGWIIQKFSICSLICTIKFVNISSSPLLEINLNDPRVLFGRIEMCIGLWIGSPERLAYLVLNSKQSYRPILDYCEHRDQTSFGGFQHFCEGKNRTIIHFNFLYEVIFLGRCAFYTSVIAGWGLGKGR